MGQKVGHAHHLPLNEADFFLGCSRTLFVAEEPFTQGVFAAKKAAKKAYHNVLGVLKIILLLSFSVFQRGTRRG
jgi:hypothetical protein